MNKPQKNTVVAPSVSCLIITPDMALSWLEKVNTNNRPVIDAYVHRLARDMKEGRWILTHEGIAFGPDGTLLDGQHRLWAIVEAETPIRMHVWFNVPPEALMAIDTGKARSLADILHLGGGFGRVTLKDLAVLRTMLGGMSGPVVLTPSEAADALARHGRAIAFAVGALPNVRYVSSAPTRAVLARAYYTVSRDRLAEFGKMVASGIVPDSRCTSVILLRQYLQSNIGVSRVERRERYAKTQRALSAFLFGEPITRLYAVTEEQFSLPEEAKEGTGTNRR